MTAAILLFLLTYWPNCSCVSCVLGKSKCIPLTGAGRRGCFSLTLAYDVVHNSTGSGSSNGVNDTLHLTHESIGENLFCFLNIPGLLVLWLVC